MNELNLILLIDDDEINNFINESIIKSILPNTKVISYLDPLHAFHFLINDFTINPSPIVIFLDINMPQMSGWEFIDELEKNDRIDNSYLSVFMISSSIDSSDKLRSLDNSLVKDFVSKPLTKEIVQSLFKI